MSNEHHAPIATGADADAAVFNAPLAELDEAIVETKEDVTALDARLDTAESNITTLQSNVTNLQGRMTTAEGEIDTLQSNVTSLDARLDTAEPEIDTLQSQMSTANSNISNLQGRMTTAEGEIDTLQSAVTSLDGRLDTAEADIDALQILVAGNTIRSKSAADTIALEAEYSVYKIINTGTINTLTPVDVEVASVIFIVCAGAWTFGNSGNINRAYTPYSQEVICLVYDTNANDWKFVNTAVGNLTSLSTSEKNTAVGAINEVNTLAGWNKATTVTKASAITLALNAGVARYLITGSNTIDTISAPAGSPTVIYLMNDDGEWEIDYGGNNIVGVGLAGANMVYQYEVICLVYNDATSNWHRLY